MKKLILTGDINLMGFDDHPNPFTRVAGELRAADFVFSNLECCLYDPPLTAEGKPVEKGYFAPAEAAGEALKAAGVQAVGMANNVNLGREPILNSIARLDALGILHAGAGKDAAAARAPLIWESDGLRVGIVQRTSVHWAGGHEATRDAAGVAVVRGITAYQVPEHRTQPGMTLFNRPGLPPVIVTWVDPPYLKAMKEDVAALRAQCDVVIMSCHWGYHGEVLDYMPEWAHAAIEAGADIVLGHGPHFVLPIEIYRGKPIFYGLGSFSFYLKGDGSEFGHWVGSIARVAVEDRKVKRIGVQFVRHNERNETVLAAPKDEPEARDDLIQRSATYGTRLIAHDDEIEIVLE